MSSLPSVDDLRLVDAVLRHGSVGAASRELLLSQPAASKRLAVLERRVGVALFDRDTTGARPTPAGRTLAADARHLLDHLGELFDRSRAAARGVSLTVGTFPSLAPLVFPALETLVEDIRIHQVADHGDRLVAWVAEGSLSGAVVAIADQLELPPGVVATRFASDDMVCLLPAGVPRPGRRRKPWSGQPVVVYTYDLAASALHDQVAHLGGQPRPSSTAETAVRLARVLGGPALVPSGVARAYRAQDEVVVASPVRRAVSLFLVTQKPGPTELTEALPRLATRLGLRRASSPRSGRAVQERPGGVVGELVRPGWPSRSV